MTHEICTPPKEAGGDALTLAQRNPAAPDYAEGEWAACMFIQSLLRHAVLHERVKP